MTDPKDQTANQISGSAPGGRTAPGHFQQRYHQGGKFKEQLEAIASTHGKGREEEPVARRKPEITEVQEIPTAVELEKKPELAGYIEKAEKDAELTGDVVDDYTGQILMSTAKPQKPVVKLPLTEEQVNEGLHHKVYESIRWLAEWCVRQAKLLHATFKQTDNA